MTGYFGCVLVKLSSGSVVADLALAVDETKMALGLVSLHLNTYIQSAILSLPLAFSSLFFTFPTNSNSPSLHDLVKETITEILADREDIDLSAMESEDLAGIKSACSSTTSSYKVLSSLSLSLPDPGMFKEAFETREQLEEIKRGAATGPMNTPECKRSSFFPMIH